MGYKNKKYYRDLKQQIYDRFEQMDAFGESKRIAIETQTDGKKIHSKNTYKTYRTNCNHFADYVSSKHPDCKSINQAKKYVLEWAEYRANHIQSNGEHYSAWTLSTEYAAVRKLYGLKPDSPYYPRAPKRERQNIKRSRGEAVRDKHFSEKNNDEFVKFCKGTGCRRNVIEKLRGGDLARKEDMEKEYKRLAEKEVLTKVEAKEIVMLKDALETFPDQDAFIHHRSDKGGRPRYAPIIGENKDQIIKRMEETPLGEKVWLVVPSNADIHSYRGDYATATYKMYARPIEEIPYKIAKNGRRYQPEVYCCRKDEKGKKLDKEAMRKASKALGHNRLEVVANNYLRGL